MTNQKPKTKKKSKLRNAEYYDMQLTFDNLYAESKNNKIFNNLMNIISSEQNIELAYRNLKKNKGSNTAGVDKKTIENLKSFSTENLIKYIKKSFEWYTPNAVRRVGIPKDNGKIRPLGIPTIKDRLIQQCILQVLEPICEAKFFDRSNGFRPNRSTEHAIAQCMTMIQQRNCHYVVDIDIKGFFDNVNHSKLLKQIWTMGIQDKKLISIISSMLKDEVANIGFTEKGTPQGGIISPLLSNIVLNELDWWIASCWEEIPTKHDYKCNIHANGSKNKNPIYSALRKTKLKECYIVRYADDFKIFCKSKEVADRLFIATKLWLKDRLNLDISPEKSKIVNLKRHYSEFLGFRLKAKLKGKKYIVRSHITEKAKSKILTNARRHIWKMQHPKDSKDLYKQILLYNSFVMGVHNYYCLATFVNKDFHAISFLINKPMKGRIKPVREGVIKYKAIKERYGKSKEMRFHYNLPIVPIGYVQHKNPMWKKSTINKYTKTGREEIHKNLKTVDTSILIKLMKTPILNRSIEYNDNRLSLYCAQVGKCAITNKSLDVKDIHCHHKTPIYLGGKDDYKNLIILSVNVHKLIHATNIEIIAKYKNLLNLTDNQLIKLNKLRVLCNLNTI